MRDFKKLLIWQKAMDLTVSVYRVVEKFPSEERFGLRSQATRSAVSIAANIAEGSAKSSQRDYKRFCEVALGSSFELETHMLVAGRMGWLADESVLKLISEEQKMLSAFINRLKD
jgi:four helix bundle protein